MLCDYAEENWPSMEMVAAMLLDRLNRSHAEDIRATRVQPMMKRWAQSCLPSQTAFNADRVLNRMWHYPDYVRSLAKFDLYHVIDHSYAQLVHRLAPERTVVTCHDTDAFRCLLQPEQEPRSYWFRAMARHILRGLEKAASIVCVSDATRQQLLRYGIAAPDRIHVVHNGLHPAFRIVPDLYWDVAATEMLGASGGGAEILHVGGTIPRKRIDSLLRVFAECRKHNRELRLIHVGQRLTPEQLHLLHELGLEETVTCLPFLSQELLAAIYRRAALLLVTSEAEGFGLPLVEAMASGACTVASDIPALREVGGTASSYCPVGCVENWTRTVLDLIATREKDPEGWNGNVTRGIARARTFSWDRNAAMMAQIYRTVLSKN